MKVSKIFKTEDGTKYRITISLFSDYTGEYWSVNTQKCLPGKRKFEFILDPMGHEINSIPLEKRRDYTFKKNVENIPREWIGEVYDMFEEEMKKTFLKLF